jgi:outer membrane protein OmpA-like peptidoglycan-associated protein
MKAILLIFIVPLLVCCSLVVNAQQTGLKGINYQAVARNGKNEVLVLQAIQVKFSILDGSEAGTPVFVEVQNATTTVNGLFTMVIGHGTAQIGGFDLVDWSKGNQFLRVEISINGDGNFETIGVMPFMSVPYALYAANGGSGGGGGGGGSVDITWLGSYTTPPASAIKNQAYYNSVDKKAYIYDSTGTWQILAQDGNPGTGVYWLGTFATVPADPALNQAYYNTTDRKAYIYDGTAWQIMAQDGISLHWLGTFATAPASPVYNDGYYNTTDRASYIYDGTAWQILAEGGSGFTIQSLNYTDAGHSVLTTSLGDSIVSPARTWLVGGNKGTDGNADFIGTLDSVPLIIKTSGNGISSERMRFSKTASVLVNGTADTASLQGLATFTVYSGNAPLAINTSAPLNGINAYASGNSAAIFGRNYGSGGYGVKGVASAGVGVYGYSSNRDATAIRGETSSINGGFGVIGLTNSPGVFNFTLNTGSGVLGIGANISGIGVVGVGNNPDLKTLDLKLPSGLAGSPTGAGVAGVANTYGVYGIGLLTASGVGVAGGGTGLKPIIPAAGAGVSGNSYNIGVAGFAVATNALAPELNRWGGYFEYKGSNSALGTTLVYSYLAGRVFDAGTSTNIYVGLASSGTKSTIVKDDEGNRRLLYCTEAPEILFQDFGTSQLSNGTAHIDLERLLTRSIRVDEKHPLKVFIQLEGECNGVFVTNKSSKGFDVKELQSGKSDVPFTWQIVASRADETDADGTRIAYSDSRFGAAPNPLKTVTDEGTKEPVKAVLKTEEAAIVNKAFKNLQFSTGKAEITKSSYSSLDNIATLLKEHPEWQMKLSGHTDNEGTPAFNQTLSEKRSEAVKQYLASKGVDNKQITTAGYGQSKPLTTNQTKAEREKNRRVEMEIFTEQR